ncbi:MAG: hypothetical protein HYV97_05340 [Bdellovibrio sp.]|nr:hypothetical protein [Bdellovibrio sp.]
MSNLNYFYTAKTKICFILVIIIFAANFGLADDSNSSRPGKFRKKSNAAERESVREQEKQKSDQENARKQAYDDSYSAISDCEFIHRSQNPSSLTDKLSSYKKYKQAALAGFSNITKEEMTMTFRVSGESTEMTKTIGEWFAFCDKSMTGKISNLDTKVKSDTAQAEAEDQKRKAYNDRVRAEQEAKFKALVASSHGDRKRILESKGYLPNWPRSGDLKTAPVWKWEINITNEAVRCEMFQFSGEKLKSNSTDLGACP